MLQEITLLKIDYLSHLDYVDFNNLANTNKEFYILLKDDTILRDILYKQCDNNIYLPPNFPISKALNELYKEITSFIYKLYPDEMKWHKWINKEMFRNDLRKNCYRDLYNQIATILYNDGEMLTIDVIIEKMKTIKLDKVELIFPFGAYNNDIYLHESDIQINVYYLHFNRELNLPDITLEYFRHNLQYLGEKYNDGHISLLLFIRNYTYQSLFEV